MTQLNVGGWPNVSVATLPAETGSFTIPVPPTSSTPARSAYVPNFTAGPTGLDPYRPWVTAVLDGITFVANGWDTGKRWDDGSNFYLMGSTRPTTFAVADAAGGTAHASGSLVRYRLTGLVSSIGKETAPQEIDHTMAATKDNDITWTSSEFAADIDKVRIHRAPVGTGNWKIVADVAVATGTYTDSTTDATLNGNTSSVFSSRIDLPPTPFVMVAHLGRLWIAERNGTTIHYSQQVTPLSRFRGDDFPALNLLPIGPTDSLGGIRAAFANYDSLYVWKRKGGYQVVGDTPATFAMRPMQSARGCLAPRCFVEIGSRVLVLDEIGAYYWTPAGTAVVAGAGRGDLDPMQTIWKRMNLGAMDYFQAVHLRRRKIVAFVVALDEEPVPNVAVLYDYVSERFIGIRTAAWALYSASVEDAGGIEHELFGDDLGFLWEDDYASSQGVQAGDNTGTVTTASLLSITCGAAAFGTSELTSPVGTPLDRYSSAGVVTDENRVYANTGTVITTLYYPTAAHAASDTIAVGVIPFILDTPDLTFGSSDKKWVRTLLIDHDVESAGTLRVDARHDDETYALCREMSLTSSDPRLRIVALRGNGKGWTVSARFSMRYANYDVTIRALHFHYDLVPGVRS